MGATAMIEGTLSIANGGFVSKEQMEETIRRRILRDHFAGLAMQGLLSNPKLRDQILKTGGAEGGWIESSAYGWADAMLKAREKK